MAGAAAGPVCGADLSGGLLREELAGSLGSIVSREGAGCPHVHTVPRPVLVMFLKTSHSINVSDQNFLMPNFELLQPALNLRPLVECK